MTEPRIVAHHQQRALKRLSEWWKSRAKARANGFLAMPTGSGKTFTAVRFAVQEIFAKRKSPCVVWVAHNEFLLQQAEGEFRRQLATAGLEDEIEIGRAKGDGSGADANLIFAMLQTLARGDALTAIKRAGTIDLVIFDEFHRLAADTWREVPKKFQRSKVRTLGLSATPFRKTPDKTELLRDILPDRVFSVGYTELVRDQFLAEPIVTRVAVGTRGVDLDVQELKHLRQFHQLSDSALRKIANQEGRSQLIVDTYKRGAQKYKNTIVFCCSVDHSEAMARLFTANGVPAQSICGSSRDVANRDKVEAFRRGEFSVATSVLLLTEGVDAPNCRAVFLARPSESPVLISQMIGRAMRGPQSGGGHTCYVVDFVDSLNGGFDLAASHFAFVRDNDERIRHLVRRPPRPSSGGVSAALLLRVREYINERMLRHSDPIDLGSVLEEEIAGWLDYWDGEFHRVLLVPQHNVHAILNALEEVSVQAASESGRDALGHKDLASELARGTYDDHALDADGVSEEDFVAMATAGATDHHALRFHALHGNNAIATNPSVAADASRALQDLETEFSTAGARSEFNDVFAAIRAAIRRG